MKNIDQTGEPTQPPSLHSHHPSHVLHTLADDTLKICLNCARCDGFVLNEPCPVAVTLADVRKVLGDGNTKDFCEHYNIDLTTVTSDDVEKHQGMFWRMVQRIRSITGL